MISRWFYTGDDSGTGIYRIDIEENSVSSMPDDDTNRGIRIPFRLESNPEWLEKNVYLEPALLHAHISYAGGKVPLKLASACPIFEPRRNPYLDIPLPLDKIELVEALRQGKEVRFILDVFCLFAMGVGPRYSPSPLFSTSVFSKHLSLVFEIPKSIWEDNILPGLGMEALHSVTIRIPPGFGKIFAGPLRELREAVKTLERAASESDYESVVGKARITMESMLDQFTLQLPQTSDGTTDTSFKAKVKALRDQVLAPVLGKSHAEHVAAIMIDLWGPFSGAAHPGPSKFDRAYARFSIHQAAALLSIVSETLAMTG